MRFHPGGGLERCYLYVHNCFLCHSGANALFCFSGLVPILFFQKRLLSCYCVVLSILKCVNEGTFLCCWPVDKLSCRLTAFTMCFTVVFRCVWAWMCAFCTYVWSQGNVPRGVRLLINLLFIFQRSLFVLPNPAFLSATSSPNSNSHVKEYSLW